MKPFCILLGALILFCAVKAKAQSYSIQASEFGLQVRQERNYQNIRLIGNFFEDSYSKAAPVFAHLNPSKKILVVELDFHGGQSQPIERFAAGLRNFCHEHECTIITLVPAYATCSSYCVPIFMAGDVRATINNGMFRNEGARFGFHTATRDRMRGRFRYVRDSSDTEAMLEMYARHGVSRTWLKKHKGYFIKKDVIQLTPCELDGSNIVNRQFENQADFETYLASLMSQGEILVPAAATSCLAGS